MLYQLNMRQQGKDQRLILFEGADMLDQLKKIAFVIGPPTDEYMATIDPDARVWLESCNGLAL